MERDVRDWFFDEVRALGGSRAAAARIGVTRSYVDMIIAGVRSPGLAAAAVIEDVTGIPMRAWVDPESLRRRRRKPRAA